jgi:CRISPR/Cas system CSM-associated protein Csm3 (group 7 of RAMP superfamily)
MIITVVKALIEVDAGWAVGAADDSTGGIDRELLTDRDGRPWVPASSLAGSLRAHLAACDDADLELMGDRPPDGPEADTIHNDATAQDGNPKPAVLWLLNTRTRAGSDKAARDAAQPLATVVVTSTAVDPRRRAARAKSLRSSRIVDEPSVIELYGQAYADLTETHLALLASWQPAVGRDRTRGGGNARLHELGYRKYDLAQPADLDAWLIHGGPERFTGLTAIPISTTRDNTVIHARWQIVDALHIGTGSIDSRKIAVTRTRDGRPMVPGSTWKGLFRSRVGYIMRSVWGENAACVEQVGCGSCALCDLFGSVTRRGLISFADSLIDTGQVRPQEEPRAPIPISPPPGRPSTSPSPLTIANLARQRQAAVAMPVPTLAPPPDAASTSGIPSRIHVAIDRITGGARDKLLFTEEIVTEGTLDLHISALATLTDWQTNLLRHVIRDLDDGLIGVGKGVQRGQGTLRLAPGSTRVLAGLDQVPVDLPRSARQGASS